MEAVDFRRLMGFWATGVSVITAQGEQGPAGATANALSSLSLDPPLALVAHEPRDLEQASKLGER